MDSVSSSPISGVEFGPLPHTPASSRSKNGRTPKEKSRSGSLHKRIYDSLRFRSSSLSRSFDNGSPSAKPVKRRKSIVDLLSLSSRTSQVDRDVPDQARSLEKQVTTNKDTYTGESSSVVDEIRTDEALGLFSDIPRKRRSLGNLLNPSNILGTIANKASSKREPGLESSLFINEGMLHEPLLVLLPTHPKEMEGKPIDNTAIAATDTHKNDNGPQCAKLAEGSAINIDLFESRLARILDSELYLLRCCHAVNLLTSLGMNAKTPGTHNKSEVHDPYMNILQDACKQAEDGNCAGSPGSLRPAIGPCNQTTSDMPSSYPEPVAPFAGTSDANTKIAKCPKTPDSYLQLLIDSFREPPLDDRLPSCVSSLQLRGTSHEPTQKSMGDDSKYVLN